MQKKISEVIKKAIVGSGGSFATAGAGFFLSASIIRHLDPVSYGFIAFSLTLTQLGFGVTNALVGTPLSVTISEDAPETQRQVDSIIKVSILVCSSVFLIVFLSAQYFKIDLTPAAWLAFGAATGTFRWFLRLLGFAVHAPLRVAISDLVYASSIVVGVLGALLAEVVSPSMVGGIISLASVLSCLTYADRVSSGSLARIFENPISAYVDVWNRHAKWSLVGVLCTEMTANAHTYIIIGLVGPEKLAPVSIAALFWRPTSTVYASLTQMERPIIARHLSNGDTKAALKSQEIFRLVVFAAWAANFLAVLAIATVFYDHFIGHQYDKMTVWIGFALYSGIMLSRAWRMPESVLIQAARRLKELASVSMKTAPISILGALAFSIVIAPAASLAGILIGDLVMATSVAKLARRVRDEV